MAGEAPSHGKRHFDLCRAVNGTKLSIALAPIRAAGADPRLVSAGERLIDEGRALIILVNDRVGDSNRLCVKLLGGDTACGLRHNHAGECKPRGEVSDAEG